MLKWACIAPHGGELIRELAGGNLARMRKTRSGMERLGRSCREAAPESLIVITPHGITIPGHVSVAYTAGARGKLDGEGGARVSASFTIDRPLAQSLCEFASVADLPVAAFVCNSPRRDTLDLDWGAFVPLWFMGAEWPEPPSIVVVCPARDLSNEQLVAFGRVAALAAESAEGSVGLICSADLGHGHDAAGPYGFAAESAEYDAAFCKAVRDNALCRLLTWDPDWIDRAMTDSFWPALMLHGCTEVVPMRGELFSYQAPTYFGMACAAYSRVRSATAATALQDL